MSPPGPDLTLDDLRRFFTNPARALLDHLDIALPFDVDPPRNDIPISPDALERWAVGDHVVGAVLDGSTPDAVITAELHRGSLPPGDLGVAALRDIAGSAQQVVNQALGLRTGEPVTTDVTLELGAGRRLTGRVPELYGDTLVRVSYSRLNAKHALGLWLDLLALQATEPGFEVRGVMVAKDRLGRIKPVDPELARATLARWAAVRHDGLQGLCHLPLETGHAWALGRGNRSVAWKNAMKKWQWDKFRPERDDPAWTHFLGPRADLSRLSDLERLADDVWRDLVAFEQGWFVR
ncbi:hypothetical protein [Nocardioides pelophilus]|uniref:hypothetical protein n=1 Tax=Nocardioides pelophilus TaxID=2172019 RepID=UPI0028AA7C68|nr:hypothetical protein [Nocardioides pelophilus]